MSVGAEKQVAPAPARAPAAGFVGSPLEGILFRAISCGGAAVVLFGLPAYFRKNIDGLVAEYGERNMYRVLGVGAFTIPRLVYETFCLPLYYYNLPYFERFRVAAKDFPWRSLNPEERASFWKLLRRSAAVNLALYAGYWLIPDIPMWFPKTLLPAGSLPIAAAEMPSMSKFFAQLMFCSVVEDTWFYWYHRAFHHPSIYPYVHKFHHQYNMPIAMASLHFHPVELATISVGLNLPAAILSFLGSKVNPGFHIHATTFAIWLLIRAIVNVDEHCGYDFPWSPLRVLEPYPLRVEPSHHFHHIVNKGMYAGHFSFWDWICGTDQDFKAYLAKRAESGTENAN